MKTTSNKVVKLDLMNFFVKSIVGKNLISRFSNEIADGSLTLSLLQICKLHEGIVLFEPLV